ncbi:MAG: aminotransferase class I/II-fold pyridoxal phosphate-dependent enzyme [Gammaproteobacteria bacterium]|nr:aminotransferase class I/II-fold pyridoxal phosphate-dependent enzyme [Gammaproteobacteria bacterium]
MPSTSGLNRRNFLKGAGMTAIAGAAAASVPRPVIADDDDGGGLFRNGPFDFETVYDRRGMNCSRWDRPAANYPNGEFKYGMGVATMDFEAAPCITEALAERCKHHTWGYMASQDSLKESIALWNAERHGLEIDPETLVVSAGVYPGVIASLRTFSRPGSKVALLAPNYSGFYFHCRHTYTVANESPMVLTDGRFEIDWDDLESRMTHDTQAMIVCNPHNPTGNVWTEEELLRIGRMCLENDVVVISDEIHADFVRPGHEFVPFARLPDRAVVDNSISINSGSKTFNMAGMKNAYFYSTNSKLLERVKQNHFGAVNTLGCVATEAAYREGAEWVDQLLAYLDDNHRFVEQYVTKNMPSVGYRRPEGTYLSWLDFSKTQEAVDAAGNAAAMGMETDVWFQDWLVRNSGVYVNTGTEFGTGGLGNMRFNVGSSRKVVKAALDHLAEAVNKV